MLMMVMIIKTTVTTTMIDEYNNA